VGYVPYLQHGYCLDFSKLLNNFVERPAKK
jgi:hypothetical protein